MDELGRRPYMQRSMRILIYLLAMLTGFSAAEAARPVAAAPSALGSSIAEAATEVVVASFESRQRAHYLLPVTWSLAENAKSPVSLAAFIPLALSPVTAHDILRQ